MSHSSDEYEKIRCTSNNYSQIFPKMIWMQHFFVIFVINLGKLYKIILQFDDFHSVLGPILLNKHSTVMNIPSFGSNYFPKFLHAQMKYKIRPNVISKNSGFSKNKYCCQCAPKQVIRFACFLWVRPIDLMILDSQIRRHNFNYTSQVCLICCSQKMNTMLSFSFLGAM